MPKVRIERTGGYLVREVQKPGNVHEVDVLTKFILIEPLSEAPQWLASTTMHRLKANGDHVNRWADGTIEVARTGVRLEEVTAAPD
jgi:hypothetical protein